VTRRPAVATAARLGHTLASRGQVAAATVDDAMQKASRQRRRAGYSCELRPLLSRRALATPKAAGANPAQPVILAGRHSIGRLALIPARRPGSETPDEPLVNLLLDLARPQSSPGSSLPLVPQPDARPHSPPIQNYVG
jgi:hypothetical protein